MSEAPAIGIDLGTTYRYEPHVRCRPKLISPLPVQKGRGFGRF